MSPTTNTKMTKRPTPPNVHESTDLKPGSCWESPRRGSFARCGMAFLWRVSFVHEPVGTLIIGRFLNSESSDTDISETAVWLESWYEYNPASQRRASESSCLTTAAFALIGGPSSSNDPTLGLSEFTEVNKNMYISAKPNANKVAIKIFRDWRPFGPFPIRVLSS